MRLSVILVVIFLFVGSWIIISTLDLDAENPNDVKVFAKETGNWLKNVGKNLWELTGKAVSQKWLPDVEKPEINETEHEEN